MEKPRAHLVSAVGAILIRDNHILLLRRQNTGFFDGHWALPAGKLDKQETPRQALLRELQEETGIEAASNAIGGELIVFAKNLHHDLSFDGRFYYFAQVVNWAGEPRNTEPNKASEMAWFPLTMLPLKMVPYHRI